MSQSAIVTYETFEAAVLAMEGRGESTTYPAIIAELGGGSRTTIAKFKRQLEEKRAAKTIEEASAQLGLGEIPISLAETLRATCDAISAIGGQVAQIVRSAVIDERHRYELLLREERGASEKSLHAETFKVDTAREEADGLLSELDTLQAQHDALLVRVDAVSGEKEALGADLTALHEERNHLRRDLETLQQRWSEAERRGDQSRDELDRSRRELEKIRGEYRSLSDELLAARLAQARAEEHRNVLQTQAGVDRSKFDREVETLREDLAKERERSEALHRDVLEAAMMQARLEEQMASTLSQLDTLSSRPG